MELFDPKTSRGRELGYLAVRLATIDAEKTRDRAGLRRSLKQRIDVIVQGQRRSQNADHQRKLVPMTAEEAKLRTELLKASL
jgi:hypothetical protein